MARDAIEPNEPQVAGSLSELRNVGYEAGDMKRKDLPIVEVEWVDSCSHGKWTSREYYEKETVSVCRSVGYLLVKDRIQIQVLQSQDETSEQVADSISIPRTAVLRVRRLKRA